MSIKLSVEAKELERFVKETNTAIAKASRATINRVIDRVATRSVRGGSQQLLIPQKKLRDRLDKFPARVNSRDLKARITFNTRGIRLIDLGAKQDSKGVRTKVKIRGRSGRTNHLQGAFIATMPSGHRGVFKRVSKARLKIKEQYFSLSPMRKVIFTSADRVFEKEYDTIWAAQYKRFTKR